MSDHSLYWTTERNTILYYTSIKRKRDYPLRCRKVTQLNSPQICDLKFFGKMDIEGIFYNLITDAYKKL